MTFSRYVLAIVFCRLALWSNPVYRALQHYTPSCHFGHDKPIRNTKSTSTKKFFLYNLQYQSTRQALNRRGALKPAGPADPAATIGNSSNWSLTAISTMAKTVATAISRAATA